MTLMWSLLTSEFRLEESSLSLIEKSKLNFFSSFLILGHTQMSSVFTLSLCSRINSAKLRGTSEVPGVKTRLAARKENALPSTISLYTSTPLP